MQELIKAKIWLPKDQHFMPLRLYLPLSHKYQLQVFFLSFPQPQQQRNVIQDGIQSKGNYNDSNPTKDNVCIPVMNL